MSAAIESLPAHVPRGWLRRLASLKLTLVLLVWLASLKLTLVLLVWLAAAIVYAHLLTDEAAWSVALPLAALALNLLAAIASNPVFRRQGALLVFHLALVALALLLAAGRLVELRGRTEVTQGGRFDGTLTQVAAGPLHPGRLPQSAFVNDGFEIDYAAGYRRGPTRNRVRWSEGGVEHREVIGDHVPLVRNGYRFYTSPNKGFAARVRWRNADGAVVATALHFPAYPVFQYGQTLEWNLPESHTMVRLRLDLPERLIDFDAPARFALPAMHRLLVDDGGGERELVRGSAVTLAGGTLVYDGLTTWMGYTVIYDPTTTWLLAACVVAIAALGWHFWRKFAAKPWSAE